MDKPSAPELDGALVWLRRDLRVQDHAALSHALRSARRVWCVFLFDDDILAGLPRADRRVEFIRGALLGVDAELRTLGASHGIEGVGLLLRRGRAAQEIPALASQLGVQAVFASHDDEPQSLARDAQVRGKLADLGIALHSGKDHVVFERSELMTQAGRPYAVFTPYKNAWLSKCDPQHLAPHGVAAHASALAPLPAGSAGMPSLAELGFEATNLHQLHLPSGAAGAQKMLVDFLERIDQYHETRDYPAVKGPSYLSLHLRFGTVSVRQLARAALDRREGGSRGAEVWLAELIWRDFYHQVLYHHPHVVERCFKPAYDAIVWEKGKQANVLFDAWCAGRTGYPLVDAAMHQINQTGYMHNRLRMVVASFLCKHLGLDWRRGEAYFAQHLNDFDLAANNGGWQWAASSGCDAQPYFRIFNPVTQGQRFDPDGRFVRRYLPELARLPDRLIHAPWKARPLDLVEAGVQLDRDYPLPIVDHVQARQRTLQRYAVVKGGT